MKQIECVVQLPVLHTLVILLMLKYNNQLSVGQYMY